MELRLFHTSQPEQEVVIRNPNVIRIDRTERDKIFPAEPEIERLA